MTTETRARPITGVVGDPAAHSKSPLIHNFWHRAYGIRGVYAPFEIRRDDLGAFFAAASGMGVCGFNVTTPHKEAVTPYLAALSSRAARIGAVNTVTWTERGWVGDSTDGWGFAQNLEEAAGWRASGAAVVILGAGGAAAGVVDELVARGATVTLCNRTAARAERIATRYAGAVSVGPWPLQPSLLEGASLLVNATSVGMLGADAAEPPWAGLSDATGVLATDLIYAPLDTAFLQAMRARGAKTIDGLGMLLHQARPGFQAWRGVLPAVTPELRALAETAEGYLP